MTSVFHEIEIDCADPARVAAFWASAFGWEVKEQGEFLWMSATGNPADSPVFVFAAVPEPKASKNRLHFDVVTKGADQAEEVERLEGLGATRIDIGQGDVPWVVMADPEGNEFCVLARRIAD
ncbi:MAG TPA: VOC family protein [Microthrixaceae bacterium]|nr:VOC family protein [Microthrixaceae bacterium]